eukprot:950600-Amphidinium_carterae.2
MMRNSLRMSVLATRADSFSLRLTLLLRTSLTSPDGVICSEPQAIAAEIFRHWIGVFGVRHLMDKDAADIIFDYTPAVTWPELEFSRDELVQLLRRMKDSGAGPD